MSDAKAIQTSYKDYLFRSRLEARWAVYFDALGIEWEYEPEGFDLDGVYYLPDFWLPQVEMWGEVKPVAFTEEELEKAWRLYEHTESPVILLIGTPSLASYWFTDVPFSGLDEDGRGYTDCILGCDYLDENRFYASTGATCPLGQDPLPLEPDYASREIRSAVQAARSARFEHGCSPC